MLPSVIIMITVLLTFIILNVILLRVIAECYFTDNSAGCLSSEFHSVYQHSVEFQSAERVFVNVMAPSPNESNLLTFFASFQARRCHSVD
jgi:hypothetical protein